MPPTPRMLSAACLALTLLCNVFSSQSTKAAEDQFSASDERPVAPNVIVIFTDDQGTKDVACYGAQDLETPGVDMLAERGVRFTQFYAAAPVCSPSRVGLLTGRYPWVAGLDGNAGGGPSEAINNLENSEDQRGMPAAEVTAAEMFRSAGYATAHIGKWHLGHGPGMRPLDQGFEYSFGHMGGCIDNYSHFMYWSGPNRHDLFENNQRVRMPGKFFPDLMVEKATEFAERQKGEPFFMYFAMNTPHYPYQGEPEWLEHYAHLPHPRNLYAAFVSTLDARIKQLVENLDAMGLSENTIIVYQSDHGHSTEERAHFGGGSNGPFRGAKFSMFEGGIRVPAIISWPGHLPAGEVRDQVAHGCDWLPTVAELCGVDPPQVSLSGRSLVATIRDEQADSPHQVLHWKQGKQWAVRRGPWKLIRYPNPTGDGPPLSDQDRDWFLSNVEQNPGETQNFAAEYPQIVGQLKRFAPAEADEASGVNEAGSAQEAGFRMPDYGSAAPPPPRPAAEVEALLAGSRSPAPEERPLRVVLVAGPKDHGPGEHDYPAWQKTWSRLLSEATATEVDTAWEFPSSDQFAAADVVVFYQRGRWDAERAEAIDAYLMRGGGLVYLHWAVDGRGAEAEFAERIGLAAKGGGIAYRHGPLEIDFSSAGDHEIARNFDRVRWVDETYWNLTGDPARIQLLGVSVEEGHPRPQFWTVSRGKGRVFVSLLGHYMWTFDDPAFRTVIMRGIAWAGKRPVDRFNRLVTLDARID